MDGKNFAIGILSVTAVILFSAWLIVNMLLPNQALAFAQNTTGGNYVVTTSQLDDHTELLFIMHTPSERMNAYRFDVRTGVVDLIQPIDVKEIVREVNRRSRPRFDERQQTDLQQDQDLKQQRKRKSRR
ncbi:MAG: hypothetical protein JSV03_17455 [Planctomycetota bacterium]|nr:MAG: hypothetical protein JSV03_17455 [Planctomycetota bacterium]